MEQMRDVTTAPQRHQCLRPLEASIGHVVYALAKNIDYLSLEKFYRQIVSRKDTFSDIQSLEKFYRQIVSRKDTFSDIQSLEKFYRQIVSRKDTFSDIQISPLREQVTLGWVKLLSRDSWERNLDHSSPTAFPMRKIQSWGDILFGRSVKPMPLFNSNLWDEIIKIYDPSPLDNPSSESSDE
ncbi:hypothetical protein RRG08_017707 [Elysia crispata]|uniref:Uncharacterized protein n=1 Tax=Elysia crispata TaxID=231223 RepID=A0AAE0YIC0_9GAST|nr:hypothetical protein RRG08_017707 [Elysia crispata]